MKKTKYRIVSSGYNYYVQYKGWIFWHFVPLPKYKYYTGEDRYMGMSGFPIGISDYFGGTKSHCLQFPERYPDIREYFEENYKPKQDRLKKKIIAEEKAREKESKEVIYIK